MAQNIYYSLINAVYYIMCCGPFNYGTAYLTEKGYSTSQIGIVHLIAGGLGLILQPILSEISDRSKKVSPTGIFVICLPVVILGGLIALFFDSNPFLFIFAFTCIYILPRILQSLVTAFAFVIEHNRKITLNFGVCRSMGSLGFVIYNLFYSKWMANNPSLTFPVALCISAGVLLAMFIIFYGDIPPQGALNADAAKPKVKKASLFELFQNRNYMVLVVGNFFLSYGPSTISTYMYQKLLSIGGTTANIGGILSFSSFLEIPTMFLFERLRKRFRTVDLVIFAGFFYVVKTAVVWLATGIPGMYLGFGCQLLAYALMAPTAARYINEQVDKKQVNIGQAYYFITGTMSSMVASGIGGIMIDHLSLGFTLMFSALVSLAGALFYLFGLKRDAAPKANA